MTNRPAFADGGDAIRAIRATRQVLIELEAEYPRTSIARDAGAAFRALGRIAGAELCGSRAPVGPGRCVLEPGHEYVDVRRWCRDLDGHAWPFAGRPAPAPTAAEVAAAQPLTEAELRLMHGDR